MMSRTRMSHLRSRRSSGTVRFNKSKIHASKGPNSLGAWLRLERKDEAKTFVNQVHGRLGHAADPLRQSPPVDGRDLGDVDQRGARKSGALRAADDVAGCEGQRHVARNRHDDGGRDPGSIEIIGLHDENRPAMAGLRTTRAAQTRPPDLAPLQLVFPLRMTEHFEPVGQPGLIGSVPLLGMDGVETFRDIGPLRAFQVLLESARVESAAGNSQPFGRPVGGPEQAVRNGDRDLHAWSITISYPTVKERRVGAACVSTCLYGCGGACARRTSDRSRTPVRVLMTRTGRPPASSAPPRGSSRRSRNGAGRRAPSLASRTSRSPNPPCRGRSRWGTRRAGPARAFPTGAA